MFGKILAALRRLSHDRSANVAIITAFCALPLIGMMGLAIDYATTLSTKSKLDAAADTAVIAATTTAKAVFNASGSISSAISQGQAQGLAAFKANAGSLYSSMPVPPQISIVPDTKGQTLTASVTYTTSSHNQFGGLVNVASTNVVGNSHSVAYLTPYYQFIFLVDISGSMAIGGTNKDIAGLVADPNIQCAFACHDPNHQRGSVDLRAMAQADGWTLKIDYVNQALQNFIQDLSTQTTNIAGVFSVGINTYATNFTVLQAPAANNLAAAKAQAATIDIEPMVSLWVSQGYTRTTSSLAQTLANIKNVGDGSSSTSQKTFVIFLSDGVEDVEGNLIYGRGTDVSYTSACQAIKSAGVTLMTIIAPYPVVNDPQYPILVAPIASQLAPAMNTCATTPAMAYQAVDGPGINTAVHSALQQILQGMTRLTQ